VPNERWLIAKIALSVQPGNRAASPIRAGCRPSI
jgi:hypothetical protein